MRVRYTETAFEEISAIYLYIAERNPIAAGAVASRIEQVISRIGDFPDMAHPVDRSRVRVFPTSPFPFLVFYTVGRQEVIIRNIRYAGRSRP